jgi:hypothetical protein
MLTTGSPKGALMGAATSLAYLGVGQLATTAGFANDSLGRAAMHGATGGILSELQGGKFGHGFVQAGFGKALTSHFATGNTLVDSGAAIVVGGTIENALGGSFANGAQSAAMQYAFNGLVTALGGLVVETYDVASGGEFDGEMVVGALKDGYDGEGKGAIVTTAEDALAVAPIAGKAVQGVAAGGKGLWRWLQALRPAAKGPSELSFGRKLDFLFNKGIDQSNAYNAARARGNAERIGIADTAANRAEVARLFNQAFRDPSSIVGPGKLPGSNVREFFLPGVTGAGSKIQFVEQGGKVITIIAK